MAEYSVIEPIASNHRDDSRDQIHAVWHNNNKWTVCDIIVPPGFRRSPRHKEPLCKKCRAILGLSNEHLKPGETWRENLSKNPVEDVDTSGTWDLGTVNIYEDPQAPVARRWWKLMELASNIDPRPACTKDLLLESLANVNTLTVTPEGIMLRITSTKGLKCLEDTRSLIEEALYQASGLRKAILLDYQVPAKPDPKPPTAAEVIGMYSAIQTRKYELMRNTELTQKEALRQAAEEWAQAWNITGNELLKLCYAYVRSGKNRKKEEKMEPSPILQEVPAESIVDRQEREDREASFPKRLEEFLRKEGYMPLPGVIDRLAGYSKSYTSKVLLQMKGQGWEFEQGERFLTVTKMPRTKDEIERDRLALNAIEEELKALTERGQRLQADMAALMERLKA